MSKFEDEFNIPKPDLDNNIMAIRGDISKDNACSQFAQELERDVDVDDIHEWFVRYGFYKDIMTGGVHRDWHECCQDDRGSQKIWVLIL